MIARLYANENFLLPVVIGLNARIDSFPSETSE